MPDVKVRLSIGFPGAIRKDTINIPESEWEDCQTEEERVDLIDEYVKEWAFNYIDYAGELI